MQRVLTKHPATHDESARLALRVVLLSIVGVWLAYFVIFTARGAIVGLDYQFDIVGRRALVTGSAVVITFVLWLLLRLFDHRSLALQITAAALLAMPAAVLIAQTNQLVFASLQDKLDSKRAEERGFSVRRDELGNVIIEGPTTAGGQIDPLEGRKSARATVVLPSERGEEWVRLAEVALSQYFLLIAWAAIYFALLAGARARLAERRGERFRSAARAAELRSLRYQVNPHFLFNAFNSLSALVMTGKGDRAEEMIQRLSSFYRHSLAEDPTGDVMLADEIALQRDYLAIESVRFPDRLRTVIDLPANLAELYVPGMILQPLVENSVKYAVAPNARPVTISITAREEYDRLVLTVEDNGPGSPDSGEHGFGIGLANVRDRLIARFGTDATIVSGPIEGGYRSELRLPMVARD